MEENEDSIPRCPPFPQFPRFRPVARVRSKPRKLRKWRTSRKQCPRFPPFPRYPRFRIRDKTCYILKKEYEIHIWDIETEETVGPAQASGPVRCGQNVYPAHLDLGPLDPIVDPSCCGPPVKLLFFRFFYFHSKNIFKPSWPLMVF